MLIVAFLLSGMISFLTASWLVTKTDKFGLVDIPNVRSSHDKPMPKGGGAGIAAGMLIAFCVCYFIGMIAKDDKYFVIMGGSIAVALVGLYNDRFDISALVRIIAQIFIAAIAVLFIGIPVSLQIAGRSFSLGCLGAVFAVIWLVAVTNFYNFMDGIDGLAAAQAIIAGMTISIFGIMIGGKALIPMGLILSGAAAGFLILNFPPAKIFMGDVGSCLLGFYIASFGLVDEQLLAPIAIILSVFLFDPIITLARRIIKGEQWHRAHRGHFYQRAVRLGYSHFRVTAAASALFILLATMACAYLRVIPLIQIIILIAALMILTGPAFWVVMKERTKKAADNI